MAKIIEMPSTERIEDTYCEHMEARELSSYSYCPVCGQKLHKERPTTYRICSDCDKPALGTPNYCGFCGEKFEQ